MWTGANPQYQILNLWDTIDATSISVMKPSPEQAFATPPWLWDSQVCWFDFSNLESSVHLQGGGRPILRKSSKMPKSPKIAKFLYLAQSDPDWNHAGWGSKQPQRTPGERFWAHWWHLPNLGKIGFSDPQTKIFKNRPWPRYGPGADTWGCGMDLDVGRQRTPNTCPIWGYNYFLPIPHRKKSREISIGWSRFARY